jgi:hypothetical protein
MNIFLLVVSAYFIIGALIGTLIVIAIRKRDGPSKNKNDDIFNFFVFFLAWPFVLWESWPI